MQSKPPSARTVWDLQESHGQGAHSMGKPKTWPSEEHLQSSLQKEDADIKIRFKRVIMDCSFVSYSGGQTERVALKPLFFPCCSVHC